MADGINHQFSRRTVVQAGVAAAMSSMLPGSFAGAAAPLTTGPQAPRPARRRRPAKKEEPPAMHREWQAGGSIIPGADPEL